MTLDINSILIRLMRNVIPLTFRNQLSEKLMELGNLALASLVFGQLLALGIFSIDLLIFGVSFTIVCYIMSYVVAI